MRQRQSARHWEQHWLNKTLDECIKRSEVPGLPYKTAYPGGIFTACACAAYCLPCELNSRALHAQTGSPGRRYARTLRKFQRVCVFVRQPRNFYVMDCSRKKCSAIGILVIPIIFVNIYFFGEAGAVEVSGGHAE